MDTIGIGPAAYLIVNHETNSTTGIKIIISEVASKVEFAARLPKHFIQKRRVQAVATLTHHKSMRLFIVPGYLKSGIF